MSRDPTRDEAGESKRHAFLLRLPPELHAELRRWAAAEVRSLNGHIEFLLEEAVRKKRAQGDSGAQKPR